VGAGLAVLVARCLKHPPLKPYCMWVYQYAEHHAANGSWLSIHVRLTLADRSRRRTFS